MWKSSVIIILAPTQIITKLLYLSRSFSLSHLHVVKSIRTCCEDICQWVVVGGGGGGGESGNDDVL